jgi:L-ascorbate metabolism protein UlaG (beta-lactamase superfamily)
VKRCLTALLLCTIVTRVGLAQRPEGDTLATNAGVITIRAISHASVYITYGNEVILVDPVRFNPAHRPPPPTPEDIERASRVARPKPGDDPPVEMTAAGLALRPEQLAHFAGLRPPTVILVTDIHDDHQDARAIGALKTPTTRVIVPSASLPRMLDTAGAEAMANGDVRTVGGVTVEAVAMYNTRPDPQFNVVFHPKGRGNGYVVTLGGKRIYFAGDSACTPEMRALKNIDMAFLPMNLPATMSPAEAADCAKAFKPNVVYPYHYFGSDVKEFESALIAAGIEVRLRDWYMN